MRGFGWRYVAAVGATVLMLLTAWAASPPQAQPPADQADLTQLLNQLGDASWQVRQRATGRLIGRGPAILPWVERRLEEVTDPEVRQRLEYVRENCRPPEQGAVVLRTIGGTRVTAGDIITAVDGEPLTPANAGALLEGGQSLIRARVRGLEGDFVAELAAVGLPTHVFGQADVGRHLSAMARELDAGDGPAAYAALQELRDLGLEQRAPLALRAVVCYAGGQREEGLTLVNSELRLARPDLSWGYTVWDAPSPLDIGITGTAPYELEWTLWQTRDPAGRGMEGDPDVTVQRVFVRADRYVVALARSVELWATLYPPLNEDGTGLAEPLGRSRIMEAGNVLAGVGVHCHALGLYSECERLIEPRSRLLRALISNIPKWLRVRTDAWLAFFEGDTLAALESFYPAARTVLAAPLDEDHQAVLTQNPDVASSIAFFLYQFPDDERVRDMRVLMTDELRGAVAGRSAYVRWMSRAVRRENYAAIARDMATFSLRPAEQFDPLVIAFAAPQPQRIAAEWLPGGPAGEQADVPAPLIGLARAFDALTSGRPVAVPAADDEAEAARWLGRLPETSAWWLDPPEVARGDAALEKPLAVARLGVTGERWLAVSRDHELVLLDLETGERRGLPRPTPSWFPAPTNWPWLGREESTGRVWVYGRRRVMEVNADGSYGLRANIDFEMAREFDWVVGPAFSTFAEAVAATSTPAGETGAYWRADLRANVEYTADPNLPEVGWLGPVAHGAGLYHVALRGGPHLLVDTDGGWVLSSQSLAQDGGAERPAAFFPIGVVGYEGERVVLASDRGLFVVDVAQRAVRRVALPGDAPYPALVPEDMPLHRHEHGRVYVARLPAEGGRVYRYDAATDEVEAVDLVNIALPPAYYHVMSRAQVRALVNAALLERGLDELEMVIGRAEVQTRYVGDRGE